MENSLSVIITAHNRKDYLPFALRSLQSQTFKDYELIVVKNFHEYDDLIKKLGGKTIETKTEKLGGKIIEGIQEANGDIICLLEDDDEFEPNKLETVYKVFSENNISLFHHEMKFIDKNGNRLYEYEKTREKSIGKYMKNKVISYKELYNNLIDKIKLSFNLSSMAFRKSAISKYNDYVSRLNNGLDTVIFFLSAYGNNIYLSSDKLTRYRVHGENSSKLFKNGTLNKTYIFENYLTYQVVKELSKDIDFFKILEIDSLLYLRILDPNNSFSYFEILKNIVKLFLIDPRSSIRKYTLARNLMALLPKPLINRVSPYILKKFLN